MSFLNDNFISEAIVAVIKWMFEFINDYSIVIILITIIVRLVFLPLDIKQRKNMRALSGLTAEVENLKKRYANNPNQVNAKVNELYRERGVKPTGGCLPMLLSLILLFAFFGSLRVIASEQSMSLILQAAEYGAESVDLPQWLWVHNFWQPDSGLAAVLPTSTEFLSSLIANANYITPQTMAMLQNHDLISFASGTLTVNETVYSALTTDVISANGLTGFNNGWFGLPLLAGVTLFLNQKLSTKSQPQNPQMAGTNKFMLYFFPIFSVYICATSNAAFALYWIISNLYMMALNLILNSYFKKKEAAGEKPVVRKDRKVDLQ